MILEDNTFVELVLPSSVLRDLTDEEMYEHRRPYKNRDEDRRVGLGILRGTFLGEVQSLDVLTEPYGLTFLTALVFAVGFRRVKPRRVCVRAAPVGREGRGGV